MAFDTLLLERDGAVAIVTVNRPKVLNALNSQTIDELRRAILDLQQDDSVRVVILTGAPVGADEALRIGLVNRVVPAADLMAEARALANQLASSAPIAMRYIINAVNKGAEIPFAEACQYEATLFGLVASTEDMKEGTAAFLEKRKAAFKGR